MTVETVVIGARGYTGSELLPLLYRHPDCRVRAVGSSSAVGEPLKAHVAGMDGCDLTFADIRPDTLAQYPADLYVLALPNGQAGDYVAAVDRITPRSVIIDLSADYRFDDAWIYGQPERYAAQIAGARRIANPGCYATGAQLALAPLIDRCVTVPVVFGVSGYSGAGKTPSRKNDPEVLRDNLLPYSLADHLHEREVSHCLQHDVRFLPHVASFFRGISLTVALELDKAADPADLLGQYERYFAECPLISVQMDIPEVTAIRGRHGVIIGGFTVSEPSPQRVSLVCVLDNLLKGAATQAVQNMNLAFGLPVLLGLEDDRMGDQKVRGG